MIEFYRRQSRRLRRLYRFAAVLRRGRTNFKRLQRLGPVPFETRVRLLQDWCAGSLAALDIQVTVEGVPPTSGLIVSNHLSYLDIVVYSSVLPCAFVSKAEVSRWPVFGQFADDGGTIFVQREDRTALRSTNQQVIEYLKDGIAVVLFPEGTTTDGSHVLRFHSSMLQPAIDAGVAVVPCAISYEVTEGTEGDVAWWGDMTLGPHAWKLLGKRTVQAKVVFGEPLNAIKSRKELSDSAREQVVAMRTSGSSALSS
jgi:1-acyl-sn-glycerol-3-phosphate acyltransferase